MSVPHLGCTPHKVLSKLRSESTRQRYLVWRLTMNLWGPGLALQKSGSCKEQAATVFQTGELKATDNRKFLPETRTYFYH